MKDEPTVSRTTDDPHGLFLLPRSPEQWDDADLLERLRRISAGKHLSLQQKVARAAADEIERLRAEVADLKCSVIAFGAPAMVEYARDMGLPKGHLYPSHYDILTRAGARMDDFTRAEVETHGR